MNARILKTSGRLKQESLARIELVLNEPTSQEMVEVAPQPSFREPRPAVEQTAIAAPEQTAIAAPETAEHPLPSPYEESLMRLPGDACDPEVIRAQAELLLAQAQAEASRAAERRAQVDWEDERADREHAHAMRRSLAAEARANIVRAQQAASAQFQRDLQWCVVNGVPPTQYPRWAHYDQSLHAQAEREEKGILDGVSVERNRRANMLGRPSYSSDAKAYAERGNQ